MYATCDLVKYLVKIYIVIKWITPNSLLGKKGIHQQTKLLLHEESLTILCGSFAQGLKSPECGKLPFNCLQNFETEIQKTKEILLAAKEWQIKGTEQLNDRNSAIKFINEKFVEFEKKKITKR